jgi:hypothetical protein
MRNLPCLIVLHFSAAGRASRLLTHALQNTKIDPQSYMRARMYFALGRLQRRAGKDALAMVSFAQSRSIAQHLGRDSMIAQSENELLAMRRKRPGLFRKTIPGDGPGDRSG